MRRSGRAALSGSNRQTNAASEPSASTSSTARRALLIVDSILPRWRTIPASPSSRSTSAAPKPATTDESRALAKDLKRRGWTFVGPTTVYAFMQAMGLVNDHVHTCWIEPLVRKARAGFTPPAPRP